MLVSIQVLPPGALFKPTQLAGRADETPDIRMTWPVFYQGQRKMLAKPAKKLGLLAGLASISV
jgi:hypothetical protein